MCAPMLQPGAHLGTYRLIDRLGAGGMGEVWRGEDTRLGRVVAIKILPPALASDAEAIARMRREARTAAQLYSGLADWDAPYKTMAKDYESRILRAFRLLIKDGYIYRGLKSVPWCVTCETALGEAEVDADRRVRDSAPSRR